MEDLKFKVSSALKSIIGKDLISDEYIAIFELVKNAYDADSSKVDIYFDNIYSDSGAKGTIRIVDNGKGMSYHDIKNKWLFVAYSAKKEGTEDKDYRDKIHVNRRFAGAKGIGRFSCDKLGRYLSLETKRKDENAHLLLTDWKLFEFDSSAEFVDVTVEYDQLTPQNSDIKKSGTILIISDLRNDEVSWNRKRLLKLKSSLAKLINPSALVNEENSINEFEIYLHVNEELESDQKELEKENSDYNKIVNGKIDNFIFDKLGLKTTKISVKVDNNTITTELVDGDTLVYKIEEETTLSFSNVSFTLYYLNRSAKMTFSHSMGIPSVQYGHVFLYKNGFRVYPYGELGQDPLRIDTRKGQGYGRFIGTRELIGYVGIQPSTVNDEVFRETTSRGDGLIQTEEYRDLVEYFYVVLRRLELYVVEVQQWGLSIEDKDSNSLKDRVAQLIGKLTGGSNLLNIETGPNFLNFLELSQEGSVEAVVANLNRLALETGDEGLIKKAKEASGKLQDLQRARIEAEIEADKQRQKATKATEKLRIKVSENLFLKSINTGDYAEMISLLHHVGIYAGTIDNNLKGISLRVQNDIPLSNSELYDIVKQLSFETKKIMNISAFATKAAFRLDTEYREVDIPDYISQYVSNIIPTVTDEGVSSNIIDYGILSFIRKVKPIELNIVIDNLINNAKKARSTEVMISFVIDEHDRLVVDFRDNGRGIADSIKKTMYNIGVTTTDGSGVGLFHVKHIINDLGGKVLGFNNSDKGATFRLTIK
jgi:signal transduction histidine kinase/competence protein ComGF